MTDSTRWKATVYVGGLGPQVTVSNLHDAFIPFGDIADVSLPKGDRRPPRQDANGGEANGQDDSTSGHRGFAYVEYEDADDAKEAIDNMDKSEFFGRTIKVTAAKAPKAATEGLGSRTALWNQVCLSTYQQKCQIKANIAHRKHGLHRMQRPRRTGWRPSRAWTSTAMPRRQIPCKAWKSWTWPGLGLVDLDFVVILLLLRCLVYCALYVYNL